MTCDTGNQFKVIKMLRDRVVYRQTDGGGIWNLNGILSGGISVVIFICNDNRYIEVVGRRLYNSCSLYTDHILRVKNISIKMYFSKLNN